MLHSLSSPASVGALFDAAGSVKNRCRAAHVPCASMTKASCASVSNMRCPFVLCHVARATWSVFRPCCIVLKTMQRSWNNDPPSDPDQVALRHGIRCCIALQKWALSKAARSVVCKAGFQPVDGVAAFGVGLRCVSLAPCAGGTLGMSALQRTSVDPTATMRARSGSNTPMGCRETMASLLRATRKDPAPGLHFLHTNMTPSGSLYKQLPRE